MVVLSSSSSFPSQTSSSCFFFTDRVSLFSLSAPPPSHTSFFFIPTSLFRSSCERPTDLQQEHDHGHLPGSGDPVQRPQRAAGAAHTSPARQGQSPGQRPAGHAHCAPHHLHHAHQHLTPLRSRPMGSGGGVQRCPLAHCGSAASLCVSNVLTLFCSVEETFRA